MSEMTRRKKAERGSMRKVNSPNGVGENRETVIVSLEDRTMYEATRFAREARAEARKAKVAAYPASRFSEGLASTFRGARSGPEIAPTRYVESANTKRFVEFRGNCIRYD